jgi:hypothetical protein
MSRWRSGHATNNLGDRRIIVVFATLFIVLSAIAVLVAALSGPATPKPTCPKHLPCAQPPKGGPPTFASSSPPLVLNQQFSSSSLGYQFEYPSVLQVANQSATGVTLLAPSGVFGMVFLGATAGQANPQQMIQASISNLQSTIPDLQQDNDPSVQILSPSLGGRAGVGGFYQGDLSSPTGVVSPVDVAIVAATDGNETIGVSVISADRSNTDGLFKAADSILATLRFQGDIPQ